MFIFKPVAYSKFVSTTENTILIFGTVQQRYNGTTRSSDVGGFALNMGDRPAGTAIGSTAFIFGAKTPDTMIRRYDGASSATDSATLSSGDTSEAATLTDALIVGNSLNSIRRYNGTTSSTDSATLDSTTSKNGLSVVSGVMFIFGGTTSETLIQRYDGTTRSTDSATLPSGGVYSISAAVIGSNSKLYGGLGTGYYGVIRNYNGTTLSTDSATFSISDYGAAQFNNSVNYIFSGIAVRSYDGTTVSSGPALAGTDTSAFIGGNFQGTTIVT